MQKPCWRFSRILCLQAQKPRRISTFCPPWSRRDPVAYFDVSSFSDYLEMLEICTRITGCPGAL